MLDPGHGGKDPGAIGVSGTYEKQVSLATALELKRQLEAGGRYRVELTRARDVFIPLDDRVAQARRSGAALFVSMHADALADHSVRGASVYTLANTASDAQTAALARTREQRRPVWRPAWQAPRPRSRAYWRAWCGRRPRRLGAPGADLVGSLDQELPMLPNPERHAGFVVLKAADIPSVLVEMGFMSNPRDEARCAAPTTANWSPRDAARGGCVFRRDPPDDGRVRLNAGKSGRGILPLPLREGAGGRGR